MPIKREKLLRRLLSQPKDFTFQELKTLLTRFDYEEISTGKTSGSRIRFVHRNHPPILLHKPHPKPILKTYQIKQLIQTLIERGHL